MMHRNWMWNALCAALLFPAICAAAFPQTPKPQPQHPAQEASPAETLARSVRHQIQQLPFYSVFDFISFQLDSGKATLSGHVLRPSLKSDAERAIQSLEGINQVINQIEVLPTSSSDNDLRRAVYQALYEDARLAKYAVEGVPRIHIVIKDGQVALEGRVDSDVDAKRAAQLAGGVSRVKAVTNNLRIRDPRSPAG